ncbi:hypothetical protein COY14_00780 [Candidatus Roizmanbacteria bacterium CG_4_10_14_0_2_um_filter_36_9]|uniref:Aminoacyl-transfer RNA synthetases class-II family profile domain-containing protein n=1 Tax=Candidatus Roizmanbacteria bacterium CG_4_10_14_0_2_um_filter_36_9 TaxID=1974823 RepID=A0A2M7U5I9_9BACT|nr:MAG: hypothetical protein COY14_00780 [Candidatus Roizmanbacteria bacterium CG_4_10_14_0_2_um_filter_36_9]
MKIITNKNNFDTYRKYQLIIELIKSYLSKKEYLNLDLPVLSPQLIPESYLEVFKTEFHYFDDKSNLYLTPSPELFIKRLISSGIGNCCYLGKSFRNCEPNSSRHQREFTILEFYRINEDYKFMAKEVLEMMQSISHALNNTDSIYYNKKKISFSNWEELTVAEAFNKYAGISPSVLFDEKEFIEKANSKGYATTSASFEDLWSQIYAQEIEPYLGTNGYPTILYDYPVQFAPLSKPNSDGLTAQRFEFYIEGLELGNCFTELTDPVLQKKRFKDEDNIRTQNGKIVYPVDWEFINSLEDGMPDSTGIAIGIERLGMIFTNVLSIEDLQLITIK